MRRLGFDKGAAGVPRSCRSSSNASTRVAPPAGLWRIFPGKRWKRWRHSPARRAGRILRCGKALSRGSRWRRHRSSARTRTPLARQWKRRGRSPAARIALKRFRYLVESFLPEQKAAWSVDLKRLQSLLGEIHDLDVRRRLLMLLRAKVVRTICGRSGLERSRAFAAGR